MSDVSSEAVLAELQRILKSDGFTRSHRLSRFLRFTVEQTLAGNGNRLKEYVLGVEVFDKKPSFDPRTDTIVRVEARRLRSILIEYYATSGHSDPVQIDLPKGSYVPAFRIREAASRGEPGRTEINSIAVLPFINMSSDPANEYFSDGLTEELINALAKVEGLRVVARTSAFQFKGKNCDIREIGRVLGVGAVLEGSVRKEGGWLRVAAQLISTADGYHLWSETFDREMTQVFAIQEEISRAIVNTLKLKAAQKPATPLVDKHTESPEAHDLYLRGRYCWNRRGQEGAKKSIGFFQQAIEKDPHYALAYAGLADAYLSLAFSFDAGTLPPAEAVPRAKAAALKALELHDRLAPAHISLAFVSFLYDWDWKRAEREFQRALELDPRYAHAHHWYSHYLLAVGRVEESLAESRRALELEPLDAILNTHMGWHHLYSHQYDIAIKHLRNALEMDPNYFHSLREMGRAYSEKGKYREAISALRKALRQAKEDGFALASLGYAYASWGKRDEARRTLRLLRRLAQRRYISPYFPAAIYAGLGEKEKAIRQLQKAYDDRADALVYLKVEPMFSKLHSHPQFVNLVQKMAL